MRISGGEPLLNPEHIFHIGKLIPDTHILIETNGILLDEEAGKLFSGLDNVYFRLSFKGVDERSFEITTGVNFFHRQLEAAEILSKYKIPFHSAILEVYKPRWIRKLEKELPNGTPTKFYKSCSKLTKLEIEKLAVYPYNRDRIRKWLKELEEEGYGRALAKTENINGRYS